MSCENPTEKCATCPLVVLQDEHIADHEREIDRIIELGVGDDIDKFADFTSSLLSHLDLEDEMEVSTADVATMLRTDAGKAMEYLEGHLEDARNARNKLVADCVGPLTLRATDSKTDTVYTAKICRSENAPDVANQVEPVIVIREPRDQ